MLGEPDADGYLTPTMPGGGANLPGAALRHRGQETYLQIADFGERPADMLFELAVNDLEESGVFQDHNPFPDLAQMIGDHTD